MTFSISSFDAPPSLLLKTVVALTLIHISVIGAFNYAVDPYDFFEHYLSGGANKMKPINNVRLTKPHRFNEGHYNALILGTSRSQNLNENSPLLADFHVYDFSTPASTVNEHYNYLVYSNTRQKLHTVIIGLDMMSYLGLDERTAPSTGSHKSDSLQYFLDAMAILFSKNVFADSLETLERNKKFAGLAVKPGKEEAILRKGGYRVAFEETEKGYLERRGFWLASRHDKRAPPQPLLIEKNLQVLQAIIDYCHKNDIQLKLFISPLHIRHFAAMEVASMWELFVIWKIQLTELIEKNQRTYPGMIRFEDFSSINEMTTEAIPPRDSKQIMHWFYNGAHYSEAAGEEILALLFNKELFNKEEVSGKAIPFLRDQLQNEHQQVLDYMNQNPDTVKILKETYCAESPDQC